MFSRNISEILQRLFAFSKSWSADFCTNFIPMLVPYITVESFGVRICTRLFQDWCSLISFHFNPWNTGNKRNMQNLSTDIRFVRSVSRHMISVIFSFLVTSPAHHPITHWKKATTEHQTQKNTILRVHQFSLRWFLRCGSCILVELEFRSVGFCGGRKPENPAEKTPSEHDENRQQTLTTYGTEGRNQTRTTIVGSERS